MLNIEKVKSMTKAASYEKGPEKKNIEISSYYRTDYLGLHMVKSGIAYTVSFLIMIVLWGMGRIDELMLQITRAEYFGTILRKMIIFYAVGLILYEIAVSLYYAKKHQDAKKSVVDFHSHLKDIHKFYENEESVDEYTEIELTDEENK